METLFIIFIAIYTGFLIHDNIRIRNLENRLDKIDKRVDSNSDVLHEDSYSVYSLQRNKAPLIKRMAALEDHLDIRWEKECNEGYKEK